MFKKFLYNTIAQNGSVTDDPEVDPIVKTGLPGAVATELGRRIDRGELTGTLPGTRLLAKNLGVSVPTVCLALRVLETAGVLEEGGTRRRWKVSGNLPDASEDAVRPGSNPKSTSRIGSGRLLFLAPQQLSSERHSGVEVFSNLLDQLGTTGWEVMYRVENFWLAKKPRKSWEDLMTLIKPDAVVALGGTPVLGRWVRSRGIRTLFLGGDSGDSGVPMVAVRVMTMLRYALTRLLAQGHRRVLLPLCGRSQELVLKSRQTAAEMLAAAQLPKDCIVVAESAYARPEVMVALLRRHWRKPPPDALILLDWREFVAASGFFREADLVIPRDLSVVILSQNSIIDWHQPAITHFEHPVKLMARIISKWVLHGSLHYSPEPMIEVRARWVEGASVVERPNG